MFLKIRPVNHRRHCIPVKEINRLTFGGKDGHSLFWESCEICKSNSFKKNTQLFLQSTEKPYLKTCLSPTFVWSFLKFVSECVYSSQVSEIQDGASTELQLLLINECASTPSASYIASIKGSQLTARYWLLVAVLTVQFVPHRKHTPSP
jgi:hypothetical protein